MSRCGRCGRLLTDPKSIARGYGPHCWAILQAEIAQEQLTHNGLDHFMPVEVS